MKLQKVLCFSVAMLSLFASAQSQGFIYGLGISYGQFGQFRKNPPPRGEVLGIEFSMTRLYHAPQISNYCRCSLERGLAVSYYDYNVDILGKNLNMAYLFQPNYRLTDRLSLNLEIQPGIAYQTHPYKTNSNASNIYYGSHLGFYISTGLGSSILVSKTVRLMPYLRFQHNSSGGLSQPNNGLDRFSVGLKVSYSNTYRETKIHTLDTLKNNKNRPSRWDLGLLMVMKSPTRASPIYVAPGAIVQYNREVIKILNLAARGDVVFDGYIEQKRYPYIENYKARYGLYVGSELMLGRFAVSEYVGLQFGRLSNGQTPLYVQWELKYKLAKSWSVALGLLTKGIGFSDSMNIILLYSI